MKRCAQALAFGMTVQETTERLAKTQGMPLDEAWLYVKAAELWLGYKDTP